MTRTEFNKVIATYQALYDKKFDELKINTWFRILGNLEYPILAQALDELATIERFAPLPALMIEKYSEIKSNKNAKTLNLIADSLEKAPYCDICDNKGVVPYFKSGDDESISFKCTKAYSYEFSARCTCSRGMDLNKFSKTQINKEANTNYNMNLLEGKHKVAYYPTFLDVVGEELKDAFIAYQKNSNSEAANDREKAEKVDVNIDNLAEQLSF